MQFGIRTIILIVFFAATATAFVTRKTRIINAGSLNSCTQSNGRVAGFSLTVCKAGNQPRVLLIDHDPTSLTSPTWHHVSSFSSANSTKVTAQIKIYPNCGAHIVRDGKVLVFYKSRNSNPIVLNLRAEDVQKHFDWTGSWKNVEALCRYIASEAGDDFAFSQNASAREIDGPNE